MTTKPAPSSLKPSRADPYHSVYRPITGLLLLLLLILNFYFESYFHDTVLFSLFELPSFDFDFELSLDGRAENKVIYVTTVNIAGY